ncbi:MAG: hypothetical protein J7K73_01005 [Nanoarchaeota archaeon]|nr:hypothetical protein [Nanoarchaeota archaeon]
MENILRKAIIPLIFLTVLSLASGFEFSATIPENVNYSEPFSINIHINPGNETTFDLVALFPVGWTVTNWSANFEDVSLEHRDTTYLGEDVSAFRWRFDDVTGDVNLNIKVMPSGLGNKVSFVWVYPSGFSSQEFGIKMNAVCGNGICEPGENIFTCPSDCPYFPQMFWVIVLLIATGIAVAGIIYREYVKLEKKRHRKKR